MLYHFTRMDTAVDKILPYSRFRMNPFANLNDPHEYRRRRLVWAIVQTEERDVELPEFVRKMTIEMLEKHVKMICFSSDDAVLDALEESPVLTSSPMWAHYGQAHNGVAFLLDEPVLSKRIRSLGGYGHEGVFQEIEYVDGYEKQSTLGAMMWKREYEPDALERIAEQYITAIEQHWRYKHRDWRYEREKRGIVISDVAELYLDISDALRAIVLGDRVDEEGIEQVRQRLSSDVAVYKLEYRAGSFRYSVKEVGRGTA